MRKGLEDEILNMEKIKYLSNMALDRLLKYDEGELPQHYDEIVSVFCFLDEQLSEKFDNLSKAYYGENS